MSRDNLLTERELEILTSVGYLIMKWNYAEYCARQILRRYISEDSIDMPKHLQLSSRMAKWIEDELRDKTLPKWGPPGDAHLDRLIEAYSRAREHRNKIVHGTWMTSDTRGPRPATALLFNSKPVNGKSPHPQFITAADLRPLIDHFADLAEFSQKVMVAFNADGTLAHNNDGTPVLDVLPTLIGTLPPCTYDIA
ncbi:MAG: hypothetical protein H7124_13200 [Phycisphaerales bacterium]|nr:hypothetical protein [Hyphomonadaceae bacterium]